MFIFDAIMNFIYKHPLFRKFFYYLFFTILGGVFAIIAILYLETGEIIYDRNILFDWEVYSLIIDTNRTLIYSLIIVEQFIFIAVVLWQDYRLKTRQNCSVKYVHIEDIAGIWLQNQRLKENMKKEIENEVRTNHNVISRMNAPKIRLDFKQPRSLEVFNTIIAPNIEMISSEERDIIIDLIKLLEEKGDIPSVVSTVDSDPNMAYRKKLITADGRTEYQVLQKVTLYDHTMNVVEKIFTGLKDHSKTNYVLLLGRCVIAALAHDIGKIKKMEDKVSKLSPEIFTSQPHHNISKIFFSKMYPEYKHRKIVIEAILGHHAAKLPSGNDISFLLVEADKNAREMEIDQFLKQSGTSQKDNISDGVTKKAKKEVSNLKNTNTSGHGDINEAQVLKDELSRVLVEKRLLEDASSKDHLTRAFNRAMFDRDIKESFEDFKTTLALAFVDADKFKNINDTYGHSVGDEVLKEIVNVMHGTMRDEDAKVYRYGGEEFIIVFKTVEDKAYLEAKLEELRSNIESATVTTSEDDVTFTISIGAAFAKDYDTIQELIKKADEAVYKAKDQGRNQVVIESKNPFKKKERKKKTVSDIDLLEDFVKENASSLATEVQSVENNNIDQKSLTEHLQENEQVPAPAQEEHFVVAEKEMDYTSKEDFDISSYESKIIEILKQNVNICSVMGFNHVIYSISYKNMILFSFKTIEKAIIRAIGYARADARELTMYFIQEYKKQGNILFVNVEENYSTSKFYLERFGELEEFDAVPILAEVIGVDEDTLRATKSADEILVNTNVLLSNEVVKG